MRVRWTPAPAAILVPAVTLLLLLGPPAAAPAQVFLGSRTPPGVRVGPLFVRATVTPALDDVPVEVLFGLVVPPDRSGLDFEQDVYLLWPGALGDSPVAGPRDAALARQVEQLGLDVIREGHLPLFAQRDYEMSNSTEALPTPASFVTFVRMGGAIGLSDPATLIRIPWTPRLVNPVYVVGVRLAARNLVKHQSTTWVQRVFSGPRHAVSLGFSDVGPPAMFAAYFPQRERLLRLTDPARLTIEFAHADEVSIDHIAPESSRRERSQNAENTEAVSLFLAHGDGLVPQMLTVRFTYVSGLQSWGAVAIPLAFFVLGNAAAPLLRMLGERTLRLVTARVLVQRGQAGARGRQTGVVLSREQLARLVPGETTYDAVLALCGRDLEEREGLAEPGRKTLVYRGHREVPERRWSWGWVATVSRWIVEDHEVQVVVDGGVVRDVQARVRRSRVAAQAMAPPSTV